VTKRGEKTLLPIVTKGGKRHRHGKPENLENLVMGEEGGGKESICLDYRKKRPITVRGDPTLGEKGEEGGSAGPKGGPKFRIIRRKKASIVVRSPQGSIAG